MAATVILQPPWCLNPGAAAYNNQPILCVTFVCNGARSEKWDTMAAVVGHLGHDVSKDVVGCCAVCFGR
jgi:hypothetical protein